MQLTDRRYHAGTSEFARLLGSRRCRGLELTLSHNLAQAV